MSKKKRNGRSIKFRVWNKEKNAFYTSYMGTYHLFGVFNNLYITVDDPSKLVFQEFTGIVDKHGKEIFEGDIIMDSRFVVGEKVLIEDVRFINPKYFYSHFQRNLEVIGNICENIALAATIRRKPI